MREKSPSWNANWSIRQDLSHLYHITPYGVSTYRQTKLWCDVTFNSSYSKLTFFTKLISPVMLLNPSPSNKAAYGVTL